MKSSVYAITSIAVYAPFLSTACVHLSELGAQRTALGWTPRTQTEQEACHQVRALGPIGPRQESCGGGLGRGWGWGWVCEDWEEGGVRGLGV